MSPLLTPVSATYVPPPLTGTGDGRPAPGKIWPPDRKVWTNLVASSLSFTLISYLKAWTGFDLNLLNPLVDQMLQVTAPGIHVDVTALLSLAIGSALAQWLPPSVSDSVAWLTEKAIRAANAARTSPVQAMIVDARTSEIVAAKDIAHGAVPDAIIATRG